MQIAFVCIVGVDRNAVALLVRRVDYVPLWVEANMSRSFFFSIVCASRREGRERALLVIELELEYSIGAGQ